MTIRVSSSKRKWRPLCPLSTLTAAFLLSTLFILHALMPSPRSAQQFFPRLRATAFLQQEATIKPDLGRFGELMLGFLREDLPFTVFIPSPSSFDSMLQAMSQRSNTSDNPTSNTTILTDPFEENNYAVISRVFGFSSVPRRILSRMVPLNGEMDFDSVSGFRLNLARMHPKGTLVVNSLACNTVDIIRGSITIHLVDGVLMDSEFEQSVTPFRDDLDEESGMR